jgi:epoxyqueuosine reductase
MSSSRCQCKQAISQYAKSLGVFKVGFTSAAPIDAADVERYKAWIEQGQHGEMGYLERYEEVRSNLALLLPSARSLVVCGISYHPRVKNAENGPQIASYALGRDYHEVVREVLEKIALFIRENYGGETRVTVDTAPVRERVLAQRAGLGFIGTNNCLIIPGCGSRFFLGEILTTIDIEPDEPCTLTCGNCGACVKACPGGAINGDGTIDARRCLSYLTIEYRGELPEDINIGNHLYGCDECQNVCPHNQNSPFVEIDDLKPRPAVLALDEEAIENMTQEQFSKIFSHSAVKRTKLTGLQRNLLAIKKHRK